MARIQGMLCGSVAVFWAVALIASPALAGFIDFEDGVDGMPIASTIPGLDFTTTEGWDWVYGDWRTGNYNGPYPWGGRYYSNGNFFAWLGENQGTGIITFTASYATYFKIGYSAYVGVTVEAYDYDNNMLDSASGGGNLDTGQLYFLQVEGPGMAYVKIHDTGDYWLADDLETDALQECLVDADCSDGVFCNGNEPCIQFICHDATPVDCPDDGLFCNGTESCGEDIDQCVHSGNPCPEDETCNEETDTCDKDESDDDSGEEVGVKSVGGCGC